MSTPVDITDILPVGLYFEPVALGSRNFQIPAQFQNGSSYRFKTPPGPLIVSIEWSGLEGLNIYATIRPSNSGSLVHKVAEIQDGAPGSVTFPFTTSDQGGYLYMFTKAVATQLTIDKELKAGVTIYPTQLAGS